MLLYIPNFVVINLFYVYLLKKVCYTYNGGSMRKVVINIFIIVYFIITLFTTFALLSYNDFNVAVLNGYSLITKKDGKNLDCDKGSLLVIKNDIDVHKGDRVFYYDTYDTSVDIKVGKVEKVEVVNDKESTITFEGDVVLSSEYVIGSEKNTREYETLGTLYDLFTSRWGYLFIIIFPMLIAFIYEIYEIIREFKK